MPGFPPASSAQGTTHTARNKRAIIFRCGSSSKSSLQDTAPTVSRTAGPGDGHHQEEGENLPLVDKTLDSTLSLRRNLVDSRPPAHSLQLLQSMGVAPPPKAAPPVVAAMAPHFHANGNALGAPAGPNGPYGASATAFDTLARSPRRWESLLSTTTKLATISPSSDLCFPVKGPSTIFGP
mmetsp:Transcript_25517/g.32491  ORF Transcript_25517/g.32491 Transcript_25517/m.32491 type:complete len:180 (-) Transcript_25517:178-717(-)